MIQMPFKMNILDNGVIEIEGRVLEKQSLHRQSSRKNEPKKFNGPVNCPWAKLVSEDLYICDAMLTMEIDTDGTRSFRSTTLRIGAELCNHCERIMEIKVVDYSKVDTEKKEVW